MVLLKLRIDKQRIVRGKEGEENIGDNQKDLQKLKKYVNPISPAGKSPFVHSIKGYNDRNIKNGFINGRGMKADYA